MDEATPSPQPDTEPAEETASPKVRGPKSLARYRQKQLNENASQILPALFKAVLTGIEKREKHSMELGAKIYELLKGGGITINNNNQQAVLNSGSGSASQARNFATVVRGAEERERQISEGRGRALPAPAEKPVDFPWLEGQGEVIEAQVIPEATAKPIKIAIPVISVPGDA